MSAPGQHHASGTERGGNAGEAFLRRLAERDVDYFFANAGTDFAPIIEGFARLSAAGERAPLPVTVPHENLAVAMAHGCYLVTGRPQCVMLHVSVGTANALCGLLNAARENVPLLLAAGRTPITEGGEFGSRNAFIHWGQEMFDQAGMLRELVKWEYELRTPRQVEAVVDRALAVALSSPRGPVYLTLPREVLAQPSAPSGAAAAGLQPAAAAPAPDPGALAQAAQWLAAAENPVVITASFGRRTEDVAVLGAFAERHAVPVVGYRNRYVFLPTDHPMHLGYEPGALLADADAVLVLDCDVPWIPDQHAVRPDAKVVHLGEDPVFARYPIRTFRGDLAVAAGSAAALSALDAALARSPLRDEGRVRARRERLARLRAEVEAARKRVPKPADGAPTSAAVAEAINRVKRPGDIVVSEAAQPLEGLDYAEPGTFFAASPAGGLGWGLGAALGVKLGARDRRVFCLLGDGAYMFGNPTPAHLVSAALGLPTLTVVLNNRMWAAVRRATLHLYPDGEAAQLARAPLTWLEPSPAYERIVEASGGYGERVERAADLEGALARALHAVETEGRQALLNVLVPPPAPATVR